MAKKRTHISVSPETLARLQATARAIVDAVEKGVREDPGICPEFINPAGCGLSLDAVINLLLDEREAHQRRAREQRERQKARKKGASE